MNLQELKIVISAQDTSGPAIQSARRNITAIGSCVEEMSSSLSSAVSWLSRLGLAAGLSGGFGTLAGSLKDVALVSEKLGAQFKVAFGTLAGSELSSIRSEANRLGLDITTTAESFGKFALAAKNSSIEGSVAKQAFLDITGALAAMKLSSDETGRIFAQVQQSMAKGKIELEDMKIIAEAGIPIFDLLSQAMGKPQPVIMKMISDGKLLASEVWPAVGKAMKEGFGSAPVDGAQAAINRFNNALFVARENFVRTWVPTLASGLATITENIGMVSTAAIGIGTSFIGGRLGGMAVAVASVERATLATRALTIATGAFNSVIRFLGGPLGAIITLVPRII